jgi:tetratricopeptide (TPR) repeat protein
MTLIFSRLSLSHWLGWMSLTTIATFSLGVCPRAGLSAGFSVAAVSKQTTPASATPTEAPKKPPQKDEFPPNPLELAAPDPLLPGGLKTPLSAVDRSRLMAALADLNTQASAKLKAGDTIAAFTLWNRELRLRRALGLLEEVTALGRVGDIAWKQNQPNQVRVITLRLQAIQAQVQPSGSPKPATPAIADRAQVLPALGTAYQQVRSPGLALSVYEGMVAEARQRKDAPAEVSLLNTIGQLHLSWFDYPKATAAYTELLNLAKARGDRPNETASLIQLAYAHEQAKQPKQAVIYQQQLVAFYLNSPQQILIPALKLRMADNYAASGQFALAEQTYQETFTLSQSLVQLAYAAEALRKLGALYRQNDRPDAALKIYEYLVMDAYDQIGQIHLTRKAFAEAVTAFSQGLELAKQINHRTDYFTNQVQLAQKSLR